MNFRFNEEEYMYIEGGHISHFAFQENFYSSFVHGAIFHILNEIIKLQAAANERVNADLIIDAAKNLSRKPQKLISALHSPTQLH